MSTHLFLALVFVGLVLRPPACYGHPSIVAVDGDVSKSAPDGSFVYNGQTSKFKTQEKVLLVLVDGLRWDLYNFNMSALDRMKRQGVKAAWMDPTFITQSAPSMMTIATGLYDENHGVLHNLAFNATTHKKSPDWPEGLNNTWWYDGGGEPVWVTAIKQGRTAGSFMYPGGQRPIKGVLPNKHIPYTYSLDDFYKNLTWRVDIVWDWLYKDDLDVVFLYIAALDDAVHDTGFHGNRTTKLIGEIDKTLNYLMDRMAAKDDLNVVVCSDHGQAKMFHDNEVVIYDYIDPDMVDFLVADYGPIFHLKPKDGLLETVYERLKDVHPALHVYKKEDFPEVFHYANTPRALPIIGYVEAGWLPYSKPAKPDSLAEHGYDNRLETMKGIFYATGPSFKTGYLARHIPAVNIYPMLCEILGIQPAPNNGSRKFYKDMMVPSVYSPVDRRYVIAP